jgi:hypothetical protein
MDYFEVIDHIPGSAHGHFRLTSADEWEAIKAAACCEQGEIIAYDESSFGGFTVFSDDPEVYSGRWWHEQVVAVRAGAIAH